VGRYLGLRIPLPLLIGLQTFRIGVELTLHKLWEVGAVPHLLTLSGGNVEILIGLSAPAIAWISLPNVAMGMFPFSFIPGFMAPLAVMLHVLALRAASSATSQITSRAAV
jgi:hypothetical protein